MYLMYVDESGDSGLVDSPTDDFVLTGLVVHEPDWLPYLNRLIAFRRRMRDSHGLLLREELHASRLLTRPGALVRIKKNDRLTIIRAFTHELSQLERLRLICVHVDKRTKNTDYDVFERAWTALIQRFLNTIERGNFPHSGAAEETGMLFPDDTDQLKLTRLVTRLRRYNPVPNQPRFGSGYRNLPIERVIEHPSFRDSAGSYYVQAADLAAFLLYQSVAPSSYVSRKGARWHFDRLLPIVLRQASASDPRGVVRL